MEVGWREALSDGAREAGVDALVELVLAALAQELPVLVEDPDLRDVARASSAANIALVVELASGRVVLESMDPPPQAVAFAAELARRNVPVGSLARAYRVAEIALWEWGVRELRARLAGDALADGIEGLSLAAFETGDAFSTMVIERYAVERERWMRSADAVRLATVEELLGGGHVDAAAASRRLRYELGQLHQAFVVWADAEEAVPETAAASVGGPRALLVPLGAGLVAGWGPAGSVDPAAAGGAAGVALGSPGRGVRGFRASHLEAMEARRVARLVGRGGGRPGGDGAVHYDEVALLAVLTKDPDQAQAFAARVLGPLAADDEAARRLAGTLHAVLEEQGSPRAAARRLGVHENTVAKRMRTVVELLGVDPSSRPAEFLAALSILGALRGQRPPGR